MLKEQEQGSQESLISNTSTMSASNIATIATVEFKTCCDCKKTFKSCVCKSCGKCGTLFQKYWGTPVVKGRSHCRICCAAVCITCHVIVYGTFKICTRCHIKQKEDELSTQMALSAISDAKIASDFAIDGPSFTAATVGCQEKRNEILCSAAKKGDHHVVSTILSAGADVNYKDNDGNSALYYAAAGSHLPCIALLLEKGANSCATNKAGWTPLHVLAHNGSGENVIECADLLIQMGAGIFAMTEDGETAGDLAELNSQEATFVDILRAAEVEESVRCLYEKVDSSEFGKDRELLKYFKTLLKIVTETQTEAQSQTTPLHETEETLAVKPAVDITKKTMSLNRNFQMLSPRKNHHSPVCQLCGRDKNRVISDNVAPVVLNDNKEVEISQMKELLAKCTEEKEELEQRCKRLMNSVSSAASATEQREVELRCLQLELKGFREERELALQRCEATCTNKVTKIQQEAGLAVHQANERLEQAERDRTDLLHLHSVYRITWIPDKMVFRCMNSRCRAPFSQTKRRHHCRCCGRVYCSNCSSNLSPIPQLTYTDPVRLCNSCFALLDDTFEEVDAEQLET